jgi:hypothetical protein
MFQSSVTNSGLAGALGRGEVDRVRAELEPHLARIVRRSLERGGSTELDRRIRAAADGVEVAPNANPAAHARTVAQVLRARLAGRLRSAAGSVRVGETVCN